MAVIPDIEKPKTGEHHVVVCTTCRHEGATCRPGADLIAKLRVALAVAVQAGASPGFEVSGIACMAGCSRPCTVAFKADGKATYLFGDVDPEEDIDALVAFAQQYEAVADGWTKSSERPAALLGKTLARVPASVTIVRQAEEALQ